MNVGTEKRCAQRWFCGVADGPHSPPIASCMKSTSGTKPLVGSTYCEKSICASSCWSASVNADCMREIAKLLNSPLQLGDPYGFCEAHVLL